MKISVFCSEKNKADLPQLRIALDDYFIEYQTVLFNENTKMEDTLPVLRQVLDAKRFYLLIP
ncbi:MAG: hypothetical protein PQJ58_02705 [Spirochaetales bacterium]|nr:hypothetical protein [Spirochaetales bacterium]